MEFLWEQMLIQELFHSGFTWMGVSVLFLMVGIYFLLGEEDEG